MYTPREAILCIGQKLKNEWNIKYTEMSRNKGRLFAEFCPDIHSKPWYYTIKLPPKDTKVLNRIILGHTYDKTYLHRIGVSRSPNCDMCNTPETSQHIIFECQRYIQIRSKYDIFTKFQTVKELVANKQAEDYKLLSEFIREANLEI